MKEWTNINLTRYCRFVLSRTPELSSSVRAFHIPEEILIDKSAKKEAFVLPGVPIVFYGSLLLSKETIWHECGHIAMNHSKIPAGCLSETEFQGRVPTIRLEADGESLNDSIREWVLKEIDFEEKAVAEKDAHLWAIEEATSRGFHQIAKRLVLMMGESWDSKPEYAEAKRRIFLAMSERTLVRF